MDTRAKRLPREVREQQMLDAAVRVFGRRGYQAASMDEIAEAAGVSKPLVYLYLTSKDALFSACIRREASALKAAIERAAADARRSPERTLWSALLAFFSHTAQHPDGWAILHRQARTHGEPFAAEVASLRAEIVAYVATLVTSHAQVPQRVAAPLAHALAGAAESLADWANDTPGASARDAATTLMTLTWPGLSRLTADAS
ncbi:TetR/AcrR family transcriptional regulator [Streptomyces sp. CC228A]|uniref:TetR/AcrR family transcriptional regulator n=1 Tax=Streptomyces sp. CC228A TaxID=2898186 RepID=UPI001F35C634|nr:TetR/AcrR family transcriptional regulator [Streptomyces sp. CC228A]